MSNDKNTKVTTYKNDLQKRLHFAMIDIKKCRITESYFKSNPEIFFNRFGTYENFDFISNSYLWETFLKYDNQILNYILSLAKEIKAKRSALSEHAQLVSFFLEVMTISPKDAPPLLKKEDKKNPDPLTMEDILTGLEEIAE